MFLSVFFGLVLALTCRVLVSSVIEIKSDTTLAEAVKVLSHHNILSAPVVSVDASEDATWIDRYIGIVEFAGIVVWILNQVTIFSPHTMPIVHVLSVISIFFLALCFFGHTVCGLPI